MSDAKEEPASKKIKKIDKDVLFGTHGDLIVVSEVDTPLYGFDNFTERIYLFVRDHLIPHPYATKFIRHLANTYVYFANYDEYSSRHKDDDRATWDDLLPPGLLKKLKERKHIPLGFVCTWTPRGEEEEDPCYFFIEWIETFVEGIGVARRMIKKLEFDSCKQAVPREVETNIPFNYHMFMEHCDSIDSIMENLSELNVDCKFLSGYDELPDISKYPGSIEEDLNKLNNGEIKLIKPHVQLEAQITQTSKNSRLQDLVPCFACGTTTTFSGPEYCFVWGYCYENGFPEHVEEEYRGSVEIRFAGICQHCATQMEDLCPFFIDFKRPILALEVKFIGLWHDANHPIKLQNICKCEKRHYCWHTPENSKSEYISDEGSAVIENDDVYTDSEEEEEEEVKSPAIE